MNNRKMDKKVFLYVLGLVALVIALLLFIGFADFGVEQAEALAAGSLVLPVLAESQAARA